MSEYAICRQFEGNLLTKEDAKKYSSFNLI